MHKSSLIFIDDLGENILEEIGYNFAEYLIRGVVVEMGWNIKKDEGFISLGMREIKVEMVATPTLCF